MGLLLEKARKELSRIVSDDVEDSDLDIRSLAGKVFLLNLCFCHPKLTSELFNRGGRQVTVLEFLMEERVDFTTIESFCLKFPQALHQKNESTGNLPLHSACEITTPIPGLIPYLVQQNSKATTCKNKTGDLPIHLLLNMKNTGAQRSSNIHLMEDLRNLVSANPDSIMEHGRDGISNPIHMAMDASEHTTKDLVDCLIQQVPKYVHFFHLRSETAIGNVQQATALSKLLPQLNVLHCKQSHWDLNGWTLLMSLLQSNKSIWELTLVIPSLSCNAYMEALEQMLPENQRLELLTLINRSTDHYDFTNMVRTILDNNIVSSLTMVDMYFGIEPLARPLTQNTTMKEWNMEGCKTLEHERLALVLEESNRSLEKVIVPSFCPKIHAITYWTALNRFGRRNVQNPNATIDEFCFILDTVRETHYIVQQGTRIEPYQLLYGLLRESPGTWSSR